jgi:alkylhydroperoxidase/carboxymuconolactone decarboxylase family protein YurZ
MGIFDFVKQLLAKGQENTTKEEKKMAEKKMSVEEVNAYMKEKCGFVPRMFQIINTVTPEPGRTFADFYASIFGDGALSKKVKELMFMAVGVSYCSPRCIIHVIPAINAGATTGEIFEAASVGMIGAGFVPGGPGIPYAFEYALKCLKFDHGVY